MAASYVRPFYRPGTAVTSSRCGEIPWCLTRCSTSPLSDTHFHYGKRPSVLYPVAVWRSTYLFGWPTVYITLNGRPEFRGRRSIANSAPASHYRGSLKPRRAKRWPWRLQLIRRLRCESTTNPSRCYPPHLRCRKEG